MPAMTYSNRTSDGPRRPLTRSRVAPPPGNESGESNRGEIPAASEPPVLLQIPNLERSVPAPTTRRSFLPPTVAPATLVAQASHHRTPSEFAEAAAPPSTRPIAEPQPVEPQPVASQVAEPQVATSHVAATQVATSAPAPTRDASGSNYRRFDSPETNAEPAPTAKTATTPQSATTAPPTSHANHVDSARLPEATAPVAAVSPAATSPAASVHAVPAQHVASDPATKADSLVKAEAAATNSSASPHASSPTSDTRAAQDVRESRRASSSSPNSVEPAEDVPIWERIVAYRPGLPALLALVMVVIGVAYVYRPQEAPTRKRSASEASDWRRTADGQRNPAASPISTARRPATNSPKPASDLPVLEFQPTTPPEATRDDAPVAKDRASDSPADSLSDPDYTPAAPADDSGDDETSQSAPSLGAPGRLASRAKHAEYRDTTEPPDLEAEPQVGREDDGLGDEGPPPDITGQTYPRTDPANYIFRPDAPAEREANRVLTPQGELR